MIFLFCFSARSVGHGPVPDSIFSASNPFFDDRTRFLSLDGDYGENNSEERDKPR